jgi:hypothetical protein
VSVLVAGISLMAGIAGPAEASPGALDVLILESPCDPTVVAETVRGDLLAQPGVASVDFFEGRAAAPTDAQLSPYDVVLAMSDCGWFDAVATGDSLADFQDQGGVVVAGVFDWQGSTGYTLKGRWVTAGYSPYEVGAEGEFTTATLGTHIASNPLLFGVSSLSARFRDGVSLTPGAQEIAKWSDGLPAVAVKGDAVGINAYLGNDDGAQFSGDFARLIVNAGNVLGRHELAVAKAGSGQGTVSSAPAGIECGVVCSAAFGNGTSVTLSATPTAGSSFGGWSGAGCGGTSTCTVAMSAAANVTPTFDAPPAAPAPAVPVVATAAPRCVVPRLTGKNLKIAKKRIKRADCKLGKVTKKSTAGKSAKVVKQKPAVGTTRPAGSKINVVLGGR